MKRTVLTLTVAALCLISTAPAGADILTFTHGIDTWLSSSTPESGDPSNPNLAFGGGGSTDYDSLLQFTDLFGAGADQIPPGALINSATLHLWVLDSPDHNSAIYQMTTPWNAAATWNSIGGGVLPGTNALSTPAVSWIGAGAPFQDMAFDLTSTVQNWSNGKPNYGLGLTGDREYAAFALSFDYGTAAYRPSLEVNFVPVPGAALLAVMGLGLSTRFLHRRRNA